MSPYMSYGKNLYLNLGSGQRPFSKPFLNVDIQEKYQPDIVADCSLLNMLEDGCADFICLHHVLEHFGCGEADGMIAECHRLLRVGGSVLITVPNVPALCDAWKRGKVDDQIFFTNVYGAYMGHEADRHKWGYTEDSLRKLLEKRFPFVASLFDWRRIPGADIARDWWILGMEGYKCRP